MKRTLRKWDADHVDKDPERHEITFLYTVAIMQFHELNSEAKKKK